MEYENAENSVSSKDLACYIINAMNEKKIVVNETKIQKLTYLVYGFYLWLTKKSIINDEKPHARPYWPVFPKVSKMFKKSKSDKFDLNNYQLDSIKDKTLELIIIMIILRFGSLSASQLVDLTHTENSPRTKTKNQEDFIWNDVINDSLTYEYFKR